MKLFIEFETKKKSVPKKSGKGVFMFQGGREEGMEMDSSSSSSEKGVKGQSGSDAPLLTVPSLENGKDGKGSLDEIKTVRRLSSEDALREKDEYEEDWRVRKAKVQNIMEFVGISGVYWY
jgi:hypothetical protein